MATADKGALLFVNKMTGLCTGGPTRVQVRVDGTQKSTVDYILCSRPLCPYIRSLRIDERQMESDHKPLVLTIDGILPEHPGKELAREVWNVRDIPKVEPGPWSRGRKGDWSWIDTCRAKFATWITNTNDLMRITSAAGIESSRVGEYVRLEFPAIPGPASGRTARLQNSWTTTTAHGRFPHANEHRSTLHL